MTFKKYPDIERLGHEDNRDILNFGEDTLVIEEKVDGGNGSFWLEDDGMIHFGSRSRDLTKEEDDKIFAKQQINLQNHLADLYKQDIKLNPNYFYYIEWMAKHTINYTSAPDFIGLDIRLKHQANDEGFGMFLGRDSREKEFDRLKIENVPIVWRGTVKELKELNVMELIPKSKYYDGKAEGIVIKNYCRKSSHGNYQLYAKIVTDEFKEDNKAVFGGIRQKTSDTSKIIQQYCTDARIRKMILKLTKEEGKELSKGLMQLLPSNVIKDILKEEFGEIFNNYKFIDFKEMKSKVPRICFRVLNEEIEKNGS